MLADLERPIWYLYYCATSLPVCRSAGGVRTSEKKATLSKSIGSLIGKIRSANAARTVESIPPEKRIANLAC